MSSKAGTTYVSNIEHTDKLTLERNKCLKSAENNEWATSNITLAVPKPAHSWEPQHLWIDNFCESISQ